MTDYVLGFAKTWTGLMVMIKKERPAWQAGLLNGVGGKIEPGETPFEAMVREFQEETGVHHMGWIERGQCIGDDFNVRVFYAGLPHGAVPTTTTDEQIQLLDPDTLDDMRHFLLPHIIAMVELCFMTIGPSNARPYFHLYYNH